MTAPAALGGAATPRSRWWALAVIGAAQFVVILDVSIVNVALPVIQQKLHFSTENLQWVLNAYALVFGGFLLLGGRIADQLGRRRLFIAGITLFWVASLVCGLAPNSTVLITARAVQGLGAAIISPASLSLLTTIFEEGPDRNKALGIWGAIAGAGGAAGVLLGGILTSELSWSWIFYINVPIGIAVAFAAVALLHESKVPTPGFDVLGAVTVTAGLALLVFALVKGNDWGWTQGKTIGCIIAAIALLAVFVLIESRSHGPLVPLPVFRRRTISGANIAQLLIGASIFAMFFFLSLYMQNVLHYSPLKTGIGYLGITAFIVGASGAAQGLVTKVGARYILAIGLICLALGQLWFARLPLHGSYASALLPGFAIGGIGLGFSYVSVSIVAVSGVGEKEAGIASGLINTSNQVGGALGIAVLIAVFLANVHPTGASADAITTAYLHGFHAAFLSGAIIAAVGAVVAWMLIPGKVAPAAAASMTPVTA